MKTVRSLIQIRIKNTKVDEHLSSSSFQGPCCLDGLHEKFVVFQADKLQTILYLFEKYLDCLKKGFGINDTSCNATYTPTTLSKEEILVNHRSVLSSFSIATKGDESDLASLY